jgi:protein gp37
VSERTGIEWTDHTFNIAWGCFKVSPGCAHCYADTLSRRYGHDVWGPPKMTARRTFGAKHWADPLKWNAKAEAEGVRRRVFCSSMCDVFEDHPTIDAERAKLWPLIRATPWLDWQLLTKRPERIAANLPDDWGEGYKNVWLGTSIESGEYLSRYDALAAIPAVVHFLSLEPLLGFVDLWDRFAGLGPAEEWWVIVGGESGPGARPMDLDWVRSVRDTCGEFGVRFFLKQLGGARDKRGHDAALLDGCRYTDMPRSPSSGVTQP